MLRLNNWTPSLFHEANRNIQVQTLKISLSNIPTHIVGLMFALSLPFFGLFAFRFAAFACCGTIRTRADGETGCAQCPVAKNQYKPIFKRDVSYLQFTLPVWSVIPTKQITVESSSEVDKISCWKLTPCERLKSWEGLKPINSFQPTLHCGWWFFDQANHHRWWVHGFFCLMGFAKNIRKVNRT